MVGLTSKLKLRTIQGHRPGIWIWFARLHLGEICESGLEYVLHIGRVDGVSVGTIGHGDFEGFESFLEIRKDPVMHRVEVLQRLYCRCDEGPLFRSLPLPLLSPVHP